MVHVTSAVLVAAIVAAPIIAAPIASDESQFEARSTSGRVAKKAAENIVEGVGQGKMKDAIKKYTNPPVHVPEGLKEAARKHTSGFSQTAVDMALGHGHGKKKRDLEDFEEFFARSTSGRVAKKAAENIVEGVGQGKMKDAVKKYTNPPAHVPEGLKDAAKKHTSGFSQAAVNHVTGHGKKKRDLEDFEEFFARSTSGRVAKKAAENIVEGVGQGKMKDAVKKYTNPPAHVPEGLKDAAKKHTSGFSQGAVNHVTGHGKKKRDLEDFEEFFARSTSGRVAKKAAENIVEGVGQGKMKDAIKKYTNPPAHVPEGLKDAAKKHTSGFSQGAVNHVTGHGKKKRDLEDFEEFFARSTSGRVAKKAAENVVEGVGQGKMKDAIKKYTNPPAHVPEGLKDAAKKHTSGFSQGAVNHVTGHGKKKRDLEDFEEFFARSTSGRVAKKAAENIVEGVGQGKMKDAIKKYTNPPAHVPEGLKDAAKKHTSGFSQTAVDHVTGHGKKKRDLDVYERDFDDLEDVFERDFNDYLEERDYFDELEEREFYELNELD